MSGRSSKHLTGCGDEPDENQSDDLDRIEAESEAIRDREVAWRPEDRARFGAVFTSDGADGVRVERGLPELRRPEVRACRAAV